MVSGTRTSTCFGKVDGFAGVRDQSDLLEKHDFRLPLRAAIRSGSSPVPFSPSIYLELPVELEEVGSASDLVPPIALSGATNHTWSPSTPWYERRVSMSGMTTGHALRKPSLTERCHRNIGVVHSMRGEMGDACTIGTVAHVIEDDLAHSERKRIALASAGACSRC